MSVLAKIVAAKEAEIARGMPTAGRPRTDRLAVASRLRRAHHPPEHEVTSPAQVHQASALRLLAEVKLRSPSAGPLSRVLPPAARAVAYAESGATVVSVLCDASFFDGSYEDLAAARAALDAANLATPLLAKEFVIDEAQIACAAAHGADAVLLIARLVSPRRLAELVVGAQRENLEPLVEVATDAELDAALAAGAEIIGVNARDLDTLEMDAERAARIVGKIPARCVAVHLSGLRDEAAIRAVAAGRADAALIGEALMRQDDPRPLLRSLAAAARSYHP